MKATIYIKNLDLTPRSRVAIEIAVEILKNGSYADIQANTIDERIMSFAVWRKAVPVRQYPEDIDTYDKVIKLDDINITSVDKHVLDKDYNFTEHDLNLIKNIWKN